MDISYAYRYNRYKQWMRTELPYFVRISFTVTEKRTKKKCAQIAPQLEEAK